MVPSELRLARDRKSLLVIWPDRKTDRFSAQLLRTGSQSAVSKRQKIEGRKPTAPEDIQIRDIHPIGSYAVNIVFSDGYDRGIFPWKFLKTLNERTSEKLNVQEKTMEV